MTPKQTARFLTRIVIATIVCCSTYKLYAFDIIAHRANGCGNTENSLDAVNSASVAAVELDVRVSRDGIAYLFHDDKAGDTAVLPLDYIDVTKLTGTSAAPTLVSVLSASTFTGYYILDLKQIGIEQLPSLINATQTVALEAKRVVFQSENVELLRALNASLPDNRYYLLDRLERRFPYVFAPKPSKLILKTKEPFIEGVSLKGRSFLDDDYVLALQRTGLRVFVWTINSDSRALHYKASGVNGIITDRPVTFANLFAATDTEHTSCRGQ